MDDMTSAAHMHAQLQILHYEEKQMPTPRLGVELEYAATRHPRVEPAILRKLFANCDIEKICTPDRRIMSEPRCLRELGQFWENCFDSALNCLRLGIPMHSTPPNQVQRL